MDNHAVSVAVVGDTHGHLQLALCVVARWQRELGIRFNAVVLCGDVGTFTDDSRLDSTTRRHGKANPCELEFLRPWATDPPAPLLRYIFIDEEAGGLGLTCPLLMVHGNHEGFAHLERISPPKLPDDVIPPEELPTVDKGGYMRLIPSGWRVGLKSGTVVAGVGGIEEGQREARYHHMAHLDPDAILALAEQRVDLLVTHQGASGIQGPQKGSESLLILLDAEVACVWCHGHSTVHPEVVSAGPSGSCRVVPLDDITLPIKGPNSNDPGDNGWAWVILGDSGSDVVRSPPPFLHEFRRSKWIETSDGLFVAPPLFVHLRQLGIK